MRYPLRHANIYRVRELHPRRPLCRSGALTTELTLCISVSKIGVIRRLVLLLPFDLLQSLGRKGIKPCFSLLA